jgi:hypothetical protein
MGSEGTDESSQQMVLNDCYAYQTNYTQKETPELIMQEVENAPPLLGAMSLNQDIRACE